MKRALLFVLCFLSLCLAASLLPCAQESDSLPDEYRDLVETLPDETLELLPDAFISNQPDDLYTALSEFGNFSSILSLLKELFLRLLDPALKLFFALIGLMLLSRLLEEVATSLARLGGLSQTFSFLQRLLLFGLLLGFGYQSLSGVTSCLATLGNLTRASIPLFGALYAMGGNVSAAVASDLALTASLALTEGFVSVTILPLCALCLGLTLTELFTPFPTKSLTESLKKNYTTLLSFLMVILLGLLSAQTLLGTKADSLTAKGAKFAAGSIIPVAGGSVSELLLSVGTGVSYLRSLCGISGILFLFLSILSPALTLLCHRLLWQAAESVAELLGLSREKRLFSELASLCGYLFTALLICSSALFLSFVLAANCATAWGG